MYTSTWYWLESGQWKPHVMVSEWSRRYFCVILTPNISEKVTVETLTSNSWNCMRKSSWRKGMEDENRRLEDLQLKILQHFVGWTDRIMTQDRNKDTSVTYLNKQHQTDRISCKHKFYTRVVNYSDAALFTKKEDTLLRQAYIVTFQEFWILILLTPINVQKLLDRYKE